MTNDNELPKSMDDIFSELEKILGGESGSNEPPLEEGSSAGEAQFSHGAQQPSYDRVEVFVKQIEPKMFELETLCQQHGIPYQACFEVKSDDQGILRRHYGNNEQQTAETQCAYFIYHLPHPVAHLVAIASQFPFGIGGRVDSIKPFDKAQVFDNEATPLLVQVATTCQLLSIPYQVGFIAALAEDRVDMRLSMLPNPSLVSCEMKAAYHSYNAPFNIKMDVIMLHQELFPDEGAGMEEF